MSISFIIPAYNARAYIERCLDSIFALEKELPEFEVIVVDDASTDDTIEIVKKYSLNHNQIVLLCQKNNHRPGAARNLALSVAKGKYILFADSDDEVGPGVVTSVEMAEAKGLDMVVMNWAKINQDGIVKKNQIQYSENDIFSGIDLQTKHPYWDGSVWIYVYRKSFVDILKYPFAEDVLYEDVDFICYHLYHAKKMAYCDQCGYRYYENSLSITHTLTDKHICDYALLGTRMLSLYDDIEDKNSQFAKAILEGGKYNIVWAFRRLFRLVSKKEIQNCYNRFDSYYNRKNLLKYRWSFDVRFALKHRRITTVIVGFLSKMYLFVYKKVLKNK